MKQPVITPELLPKLQALKQDEAFQFVMTIVENWKEQATNELAVLEGDKIKDSQADFRICRNLLNLPDKLIADLQTKSNDVSLEDFDAYRASK
jgi:hypothetical protein